MDQAIEGRVIMLILLNTQSVEISAVLVLGLGLLAEVDQLLLYLLLVERPAGNWERAVQEVALGELDE